MKIKLTGQELGTIITSVKAQMIYAVTSYLDKCPEVEGDNPLKGHIIVNEKELVETVEETDLTHDVITNLDW